jgi:hypothetical protein
MGHPLLYLIELEVHSRELFHFVQVIVALRITGAGKSVFCLISQVILGE